MAQLLITIGPWLGVLVAVLPGYHDTELLCALPSLVDRNDTYVGRVLRGDACPPAGLYRPSC
jgi:hypothetical protein